MRSAYARLQAGELKSNRIEMRVLRKFSALATALRHRKAMFVPEDDPTRYTARSSGDAATERAVMELAVEGELAPRPFAVTGPGLRRTVGPIRETILSEDFLSKVRGMKRRNLAVELLQKLMKGDLATRRRKNVVQARSFANMLDQTIRRYQNRAIEAAQVIEELISLAREIREASARGEALGLSDDELAFYDALGVNDSAVQVLGDDALCDIARELVTIVRANITIDWTLRENVRARMRVFVRRVLRKHGYPPDKKESATRTVLEQAELLSVSS